MIHTVPPATAYGRQIAVEIKRRQLPLLYKSYVPLLLLCSCALASSSKQRLPCMTLAQQQK